MLLALSVHMSLAFGLSYYGVLAIMLAVGCVRDHKRHPSRGASNRNRMRRFR